MNKKRTAVLTVTFFLVQAFFLSGFAPAEVYLLNPPTGIGTAGANTPLKNTCGIFFKALELYKADALEGLAKDEIIKRYNDVCADSPVKFDLENLDLVRKGWTRYYPFSIDGRNFVARVFLTKETIFQPKINPISELVLNRLGITVQILPGINEILSDRRIKPNKVYDPSIAGRSS